MIATRRWVGPGMLVAFGAATLALSTVWHHSDDGLWAMGVSLVLAAVLALGGQHSDLLRTVRGDADERGAQVVLVTSNIVLNIAAAVAVVGAVIEQAHGLRWGPWTLACVAFGSLYLVVFLAVRGRS
jgi:predicted MFS family arabinose efflux permease